MLFPHVYQTMRRGVVLLRGLLPGLLAHLPRGQAARLIKAHRAGLKAGGITLDLARRDRIDRRCHMPLLGDHISDAQLAGLAGMRGLARQHQSHRFNRVDQRRQAERPA